MLRFPIPSLDGGADYLATGCSTHAHQPHENRLAIMTIDALRVSAQRALKGGTAHVATKDDLSEIEAMLGSLDTIGETAGADWVEFELALGAMLARGFYDIARVMVTQRLAPLLTGAGEAFDDAAWTGALDEVDTNIRAMVARDLRPKVQTAVGEMIGFGEAKVMRGLLSRSNRVPVVAEALTTSTIHYVDEFFATYVVPAINREITETLAEGALARPNLQPILEALNDRLQDEVYFRIVANATASRSFHYGLTKAAQVQGFTTVVFSAVLDGKTSQICRELAGTQWELASFVQRYEAEAEAQTSEEIKALAPWYKHDRKLSMAENRDAFLSKRGIPTPPLHGHCRSTLIVM